MEGKIFNTIGWMLLFVIGVSWIVLGYSNWYPFLLLIVSILFSTSGGQIKKINKVKQMSIMQGLFILITFVISVAIVFGLIQLSKYLINDILHLTGWIKTFSEIVAVIISLYPVKFTFGSVIYKVTNDLNDKKGEKV